MVPPELITSVAIQAPGVCFWIPQREDRIRAHVQLCWLALLLIRVAENATGDTWRNIRHELDRLAVVTLATRDGHIAQRSALTTGQHAILTALGPPEPPRFLDFTVPTGE